MIQRMEKTVTKNAHKEQSIFTDKKSAYCGIVLSDHQEFHKIFSIYVKQNSNMLT